MANEKQFKLKTMYIGTRGVKEYRESISQWVQRDDSVLEIGCEWGTTTALLAARCRSVIGTDISPEVLLRARERHPGLRFEVLDAYDLITAQSFGKRFTKIYIDVSGLSGYRSLLDLIALLNMYATVLQPQAIIVKSGALKQFAGQCVAWRPAVLDEECDNRVAGSSAAAMP
jgi:trans-aconitate methyltransferase